MTEDEVIKKIAFMHCQVEIHSRPCNECITDIRRRIKEEEYINTELIVTVAIAARNCIGDYNFDMDKIKPSDLYFAFRLLEDIIDPISDRIKDGSHEPV